MNDPLLNIVEAISNAAIGIAVLTDKPEALRQKLYAKLKAYGLECSIHLKDGEVWIVHKASAESG